MFGSDLHGLKSLGFQIGQFKCFFRLLNEWNISQII